MPFVKVKRKGRTFYRGPSGRTFNRNQVRRYYARGQSFDAQCSCGQTHAAEFFCDAKSTTTSDPTGTLSIRRSLAREFEKRWRQLKLAVNKVIRDDDSFALSSSSIMAAQVISTEGGRLKAFQTWLDNSLSMLILGHDNGAWLASPISRGYNLGMQRANRLLGTRDAGWDPSKHPRHPAGSEQGGEFAPVGAAEEAFSEYGMGYAIKEHSAGNETKAGATLINGSKLSEEGASFIARASRTLQKLAETENSGHHTIWRGIAFLVGTDIRKIFPHNKIIEFESLMAGSSDRSIAEKYTDPQFIGEERSEKVLLKFGRRGNVLGHNSTAGELAGAETIMPRGAKFRVYSIKKEGDYSIVSLYDPGTLTEQRKKKDSFIQDNFDRTTLLTNAAAIELQGIMEAVSQQCVRAFNAAMLSNSAPREAAFAINKIIDEVGNNRSKALASVSIVQAHATGTLDTFQSRGITNVGMEPEFQKTKLMNDAGWNEADHPRHAAGSSQGGEFASSVGASEDIETRSITTKLSDDEIKAVEYYTSDGFNDINKPLREGKGIGGEALGHLMNLDAAIKKASLAEPLLLYRGVSSDLYDKFKNGSVFKDVGYASATSDKSVAKDFYGSGGMVEIEVPKGYRVLPTSTVGGFPDDKEFIFPRGTRFGVKVKNGKVTLRPK